MYTPSEDLIIIESRAGDEPLNVTKNPPSWLIASIVPTNMLITQFEQ